MSGFGELVLVVGDLHDPQRVSEIPEKFQRMLVPNKMQHVLCTGNIGQQSYQQLLALAPNSTTVVQGDYPYDGLENFPEVAIVQVGNFKIGLIHGHQILCKQNMGRWRRKYGVDILIYGHTHQNEVQVDEDGGYILNPGSITGAFTPKLEKVTPSFILLAIQDSKLVCYVYELINGEVDVSKTEFTKPSGVEQSTSASAGNAGLMQQLLA